MWVALELLLSDLISTTCPFGSLRENRRPPRVSSWPFPSFQRGLDLWRAASAWWTENGWRTSSESSIQIENDTQLSETAGSRYMSPLKASWGPSTSVCTHIDGENGRALSACNAFVNISPRCALKNTFDLSSMRFFTLKTTLSVARTAQTLSIPSRGPFTDYERIVKRPARIYFNSLLRFFQQLAKQLSNAMRSSQN